MSRTLILLLNIIVLTLTVSADEGVLLHTLVSSTEEANGQFGYSVSGAMEGSPWVIVGAPKEDPGSSPDDAGLAHRFNFGPFQPSPYKSPAGTANGHFGSSVSWAGDVDGDDKADWIVGQPDFFIGHDYGPGLAYIFRSRPRSQPLTLVSPNMEFGGLFGYSVSGVGDVNGDGRTDVAVGAPHEAFTTLGGRVYVFSGSTGALLHTLTGFDSRGRGDRDFVWGDGGFGRSVSGICDVDGDGKADIVVGAPDHTYGGTLGGLTQVIATLRLGY